MNDVLSRLFWLGPQWLCFLSGLYVLVFKFGTEEAKEALGNIAIGVIYSLFFGLFLSSSIESYFSFFQAHHLFAIPLSVKTLPLYILVVDLGFYVQHRLFHRIPILWAAHSVHHTGLLITPSLFLRGNVFEVVFDVIFVAMPLMFVGFSPLGFFIAYQANLLHQSLTHNSWNWPDVLSRFLITPQLHRVHHSQDPKDHNKNFGGLLSIWDLLFGTKAERMKGTRYGLQGFTSHNPVAMLLFVPRKLFRRVIDSGSLRVLLSPAGLQ